jgi:predicted HicB family RNase H-like nuclease
MNSMAYRGYAARVEFDDRDNIFVGHLVGIDDLVSFHAQSVDELRAAFEESVADYVDTCRKVGKKPERPASGKVMLRMPPELHARAIRAAELSGQSLNQWATEALKHAV